MNRVISRSVQRSRRARRTLVLNTVTPSRRSIPAQPAAPIVTTITSWPRVAS